jgi:hypothetical protein
MQTGKIGRKKMIMTIKDYILGFRKYKRKEVFKNKFQALHVCIYSGVTFFVTIMYEFKGSAFQTPCRCSGNVYMKANGG